mgnify:CR=1 FL=1
MVVGLGTGILPRTAWAGSNINLRITAMLSENMVFRDGEDQAHCVSGLVPGVMAQTGMETLEIIKGVVDETKPDVVIAIDALAARSTKR